VSLGGKNPLTNRSVGYHSGMATKRASSSKPTPAKKAPKKKAPKKGGHTAELKQVSPYTPNPNQYAFYQLVQNGTEVGLVYVKGTGARDCTETWQLYNTSASGVGMGFNGFRRGYYVFPSFQARTTESTDVTTRYIYIGVANTITAPSGLNSTQYQTITATCR
jgi:hypothetical protein